MRLLYIISVQLKGRTPSFAVVRMEESDIGLENNSIIKDRDHTTKMSL
jgi:hypothetical protein